MIADLVKDLRSDSIVKYMEKYKISEMELDEVDSRSKEYFVSGLDNISLSELEKPFQIIYLEKEYQINSDEAFYLTDNWDSEAEWRDVMTTAEALNAGIEDIDDDDVENYMSMGGKAKGELESSVGLIQWLYDNKLKAYLILMIINDRPIMYKVSPDMMKDWRNSESMGEYYNSYIRGNSDIEDPNHSCGCGPNPCEQGQVDQYKAKYSSVS